MNVLRYKKVWEGLIDNPVAKFIISAGATGWAALQDMVVIQPVMLAAVMLVIFVDYLTGIAASRKKKVPITSFGLRQFGVKILEYGVVILIFTAGAKAFGQIEGESWVIDILRTFKHIHYFAYFWAFFTELKSILENLGGKKSRFNELMEIIKDKVFDDGS